MSEALYQKALLRLAGSAHGNGRLGEPCCTGKAANAMCGDSIVFDARVDATGRIETVAQELKGCVLVQASASLLAERAPGATEADLVAVKGAVQRMLDGGETPGGLWADYEVFKPAAEYRSRHSCVLLPLDALLAALKDCQPT